MIHCKKYIIAAGFALALPLTGWSEAPVVDDSERFAMIDEQQAEAPVARSRYDEPHMGNYQTGDEPALVKEDQGNDSSDIQDNAKLIDKIQGLQQEIQELRGQLEVQAHDLKLLQQQQLAFYKDLDARLTNTPGKALQGKAAVDAPINSPKPIAAQAPATPPKTVNTTVVAQPAVSKTNPADEQISYMAAYELVQNKRYDDAIRAMNTFVQKYPTGGYTANAEYWLGELYLVKKEYSKAIEHFDVVLQKFPSSGKSAASMLKAGYAYAATGNNQEAKRRLQQVVQTYPDTPTAQLARSKLKTINAI